MAAIGLRFTIHKSEKLLISIWFIPLFMHRELILHLLTFYIHSFTFSSVVCCVCFSADGRYLATGCNRTTQIFDVQTGGKIWCAVLIHLKTYLIFFAVLFPMNQRQNLPTSILGVCGLVPTANSLRQEQKTIKLEFVLFSFLMAVVYIY